VPPQLFDDVKPTADPWRYTDSDYELLRRADGPHWDRVRATLEKWYEQSRPKRQDPFEMLRAPGPGGGGCRPSLRPNGMAPALSATTSYERAAPIPSVTTVR